jgi:hypothetical protein
MHLKDQMTLKNFRVNRVYPYSKKNTAPEPEFGHRQGEIFIKKTPAKENISMKLRKPSILVVG